MTGNTSSDHVDTDRNFLASLHGHVLHLAAFEDVVSAFVESVTGGNLVPVFFGGDFHPIGAAGFLVAFGQVDHVAIEAGVGAFKCDENRKIRDRHTFVVNRAAPIEVTVFNE